MLLFVSNSSVAILLHSFLSLPSVACIPGTEFSYVVVDDNAAIATVDLIFGYLIIGSNAAIDHKSFYCCYSFSSICCRCCYYSTDYVVDSMLL